ncbi:MAG: ferredoxin-NADP reductase [Saprospiraceae bacterium]|jgi:ferredoxin-NADP reductase
MWKWYDSKIIKIEKESSTTKRFWVEVADVDQVDFTAGQFVTMDLPISEKRLKRWRSYSIANAPDGTNVLEFCIVRLENGAGSTFFFEEAKIGTPIRFKGPDGGFCLPEPVEKDLVMICTGTGIAPFRSMIWDLYNHKKPYKNIHLIFGTRFQEGILYKAEFEKLATEMPGFKYSIALSREEKGDWYEGYVHPIYLEDYKEIRTDLDFYICGWSNMIDEAIANLIIKMGYDKSQVHYELYG